MSKKSSSIPMDAYECGTHRLGRIYMSAMLLAMLAVPTFICIYFNTMPNLSAGFWSVLLSRLLIAAPLGAASEVLLYTNLLGPGGTYLGWVTGNLNNLKIPCVMNAKNLANVKTGTREGEIVSTISVACSAITTTVVVGIGAACITPLTPLLEDPVLLPAFKTVIPALFGALGCTFVLKNIKIAAFPLVFSIVLFLLMPQLTSSVALVMIGIIFITAATGLIFFRIKKKKKQALDKQTDAQ